MTFDWSRIIGAVVMAVAGALGGGGVMYHGAEIRAVEARQSSNAYKDGYAQTIRVLVSQVGALVRDLDACRDSAAHGNP